jgi:hypothetical protein
MKTQLTFVFLILFLVKSSYGQSFTDINAGLPGLLNSFSLDWGDYDNDGDLDLLLAGQLDSIGLPCLCLVCRNDSGLFNKLNIGVTPLRYACVRWIDYDSDGDLDFLYSGQVGVGYSYKTFLYENVNSLFIEHELIGSKGGKIDVGDFDNDSDPDFILSGDSGYDPYIGIFRNDSSSFIEIFTDFYPLHANADFGDYDNDDDLDIALSGEDDNYKYWCLVYRNDSNVLFTDIHADIDSICGSVTWGDYDNDGDLDLLASGIFIYNTPITKLYDNMGNDQFDSSGISLSQISGKSLFFDYDSDGDLDILIAGNKGMYPNTTTVLRILKNENLVSFIETDPQLYEQYGSIAVGDYDGDGDPDFAISGPDKLNGMEYTSRIYNNAPYTSTGIFIEPQEYSVYPNPVKSTVFIKPATKHHGRTDVFIYDVYGELIKTSSFFDNAESSINLDGVAAGFYIFILVDGNNSHMFKILKE